MVEVDPGKMKDPRETPIIAKLPPGPDGDHPEIQDRNPYTKIAMQTPKNVSTIVSSASQEAGLSLEAVQKRTREYGYNKIPEKRSNPLIGFVRKFWGITNVG